MHCNWHTPKPICANVQAFSNWCFFFFIFLSGKVKQRAKNFTFCWFWLGKKHQNGLSGTDLRFEVCQIHWHWFQVYTISSSWKITISGKNFTFCWFWLGRKHQNGLSGTYLKFEVYQNQWHRFWVYTISGSWKITISGKHFTFCWFWLGKMHWNGLSGAYVRVQGMPNPMALVSSLYDKQFLKKSKILGDK